MNDQHDVADEFWGRQGDWRPARNDRPKRSRRGLGDRFRTGLNAVLDVGVDATREHQRIDATARPADADTEWDDPTPVMRRRDLLDGWPDDDATGAIRRPASTPSVREAGATRRPASTPSEHEAGATRRPKSAVPPVHATGATGRSTPTQPADEPDLDLSYGHDDRSYAGLADLSDPLLHDPDGDVEEDRRALAATSGSIARPRRRHAGRPDDVAPLDGPEWGAGWEPAGAARRTVGGVDPLVARLGVVAVVLTLLVPVVMSLRSHDDGGVATGDTPATVADDSQVTGGVVSPVAGADSTASGGASGGGSTARRASGTSAASGTGRASDQVAAGASSTADEESTAPEVEVMTASAVDEASDSVTATTACAMEYEVVDGDYWLRLADAAGVSMADLLAVNGATEDTALFPGGSICLPVGASVPAPPPAPTTAASDTSTGGATGSSPDSSSSSPTSSPVSSAPTSSPVTDPTTAPPTTDAPTTEPATTEPLPTYTADEVRQIIRDVWPDRLEDRALEIAERESNLVPTAKNYCCYGLFQLYWEVHRSWMTTDLGITSDQQLFDPTINARAALTLYQRSGGWGAWGF